MEDPHDSSSLILYRLASLEKDLKDAIVAMQGATTTLGAQITALSNQLGVGLNNLPNVFTPRLEAERVQQVADERFEDINRRFADHGHDAIQIRFDALDARLSTMEKSFDDQIKLNRGHIERIEQAGWAFAIGLVGTLLAALFALYKTLAGG